jgi:disulfide bond formation protein DsbB
MILAPRRNVMRKGLIALLAVLALTATACSEATSEGTPATTVATSETDGNGGAGGNAANGEALYNGSCIACHGAAGVGVDGLGKPFVDSTFINESTDDELVAFLLVGRPADDPANTTGIAMLPKGGNPSLTDSDLADLVAYMRSLNS